MPMSSLLLGDPTKSYFKLSLWREAAVWVERISAGDVVLFKSNALSTAFLFRGKEKSLLLVDFAG